MPFIGREKAFCVLEYARSQSNKTVQYAFVREFSKQSPTAMLISTRHKNFKEEGCLCKRKGSGRRKHQKRRSSVFVEESCKVQSNRYED